VTEFPVTTGLKVLKSYVYADVTLGYTRTQGRVTTQVRMGLDDPDVAAAMKPLLDLLAQQAHGIVRDADLTEQIEAGVRAGVRGVAEDERSRIRRTNAAALERTHSTLRNAIGYTQDRTAKHRLTEAADAVGVLITGRE